jgi:hypothetical protein
MLVNDIEIDEENDDEEPNYGSILPLLGFTKESYDGKYSYRSEIEHSINLNNTLKLCVKIDGIKNKEICDSDGFIEILELDLSEDEAMIDPIMFKLDDPINKLDNLSIRLKNSDGSLHDPKGEPHKLQFKVGTV